MTNVTTPKCGCCFIVPLSVLRALAQADKIESADRATYQRAYAITQKLRLVREGHRLASLAGLLHSAGPRHAAAALGGYREHAELTTGELDRLEGVLWIRILWLSAWQCWLACVCGSPTR